ncbi:PKD domain-containing protein [Bacillus sp. JJ1562]|uniref:PKD domain-containing protein n=1 Tax=Bacillus sp. JJ1562 TaxID=3122960 RepID=UPI00300259AB
MLKRKKNLTKRRLSSKKILLVLFAFIFVITSVNPWNNANAIEITQPNVPKLAQVGPINDFNGFPIWYKDSKGVKLELCLDAQDPLCGLVPEDFDPNKPIVFPDNYPGEAFYQLAEAEMEGNNGRDDALVVLALEATFNQEAPKEGDQTVFGRIRIRVEGLQPNQDYTITHPYGQDKIKADDEGEINYTEDIGAGGPFSAALNSRIGTFLRWDPAVGPQAPAGYVGNPDVDHKIIGGYEGQNYFRIQGPGIGSGGNYSANACPGISNCIQTDQFSLAGKEATIAGLDIQQATYSQTEDGGAIDVFVYSETEQEIVVTGDGIARTPLAGGNTQYYAHVPYSGDEPPTEVTLRNTTDNPDFVKRIALVDRITATAVYNPDNQKLSVTAKSSDEVDPPTLTVKGFEVNVPESGTLEISKVTYISPTITITSTKGGTVTIPVDINSIPVKPILVEANAGAEQKVAARSEVTLDGSASTGDNLTYVWEQVSGPEEVTLSNADTVRASFTAPDKTGEYVFKLMITGPYGSSTSTTKVTIEGSQTIPEVTANAGPDQTGIKQGTAVTLDGSGSINAVSYSWKQVGGQIVTLNGANTDKPTFTFPKQTNPVTFELTVTGADGKTAKDEVEISTVPDNLTVTTAQYRTRDGDWRIDGTSDVFGPSVRVTIKIFDSANPNGKVLGTVNVDNLGNWRFRATNLSLAITQGGTITVESTSGGKITNYPVTIR